MRHRGTTFNLLTAVVLLVVFAVASAAAPGAMAGGKGKIVVADRASGTISVIDAGTDQVAVTVDLPQGVGDNPPEPMYVVNTPVQNRVFVGDRANNRIVVFNGNGFSVETTVPAGNGVFHMWADQAGHQLWVVNDVDNTVTVIDPKTLAVIATVPMPADLVADGAKPHDVVLDPWGRFAYVTFLDTSDVVNDVVVQFETTGFNEVGRALVGEDPHVSFNRKNRQVYVPCQGSNNVFILDARTMAVLDMIDVPGAHGAVTSTNSRRFCTTNLPGGGTDAVFCFKTRNNALLGGPADTPDATPHDLAMTPNGKKLFVTHSGATADTVSVFDLRKNTGPVFRTTIVVGTNPFGLAHVR